MEETKEANVRANSEKRNGDEGSFPWEEWTVIDEGEDSKSHAASQLVKSSAASSESSYSDIDNTSDAEEARECIQVLTEEILEQSPSVMSSEESVDQPNDESDGVSVITESDVDEPATSDANHREVVVYESVSRAPGDRSDGNAADKMLLMKVLNVMIACSLVAVIGLGAGRVLNVDDNRPISTELDLVTLKIESSRLLEQMKELSGVKEILEDIKTNIVQGREATNLRPATENEARKLPYLKKQFPALDASSNQLPDSSLYERLQIFLRTICLVLEDIRQPNANTDSARSTCDSNSRFSDLKNLHKLLNGAIDQLEPAERSTHRRFLRNVDFQMNSMSESLATDLTRALDKLSAKNRKRLGKIGYKLNERLCILRNTLPSDSELRISLEKNATFLDNCEEIAARRSDAGLREKWRGDEEKNSRGDGKENSRGDEKKNLRGDEEKNSRGDEDKNSRGDEKKNWRGDEKKNSRGDEKENSRRDGKKNSRGDEKENSKKREASPVNRNFTKKARGFPVKRQNATSYFDSVEKKCRGNNLPSFLHDSQDADDTCAMLMAPPRSDWKFKQKSFGVDAGKGQRDKRKKLVDEWPGKILLKGDRGASKIWRKKTSKDFEKPKFRKQSVSPHEEDEPQESTKTKDNRRENSRFVLTEPPTTNPDAKPKRSYPANPTAHRARKNFEKESNEFIIAERRDADAQVEGDWQFERRSYRSRIRDQMRKDDSNWYFDRVGNRKNSRLNCDGDNQDPRCDALRR